MVKSIYQVTMNYMAFMSNYEEEVVTRRDGSDKKDWETLKRQQEKKSDNHDLMFYNHSMEQVIIITYIS